ncbi:SIS domain-containing protein [Streptomonospora litoralis]|uniref:Bifunctional phosphoglucose/phosphomannose isomerase n=1 Tax=Streptomonospora litoralis TaxID=2498135 RepID=A0A4P6Q1Y3_9ACTN|nr:SIS domain-containing protein [Streptomonospora litoralis]QBI52734.1 bifunctional phosphoglucose/phosphomannose isomerase [Streptomonospora litoralis]
MAAEFDESRLDDPEAGAEALRGAASAAARLRAARTAAAEAPLEVLSRDGRPRSIVVVGAGGAGFAGEVLAAVLGAGCPIPVVTVCDYRLPGWVGGNDLVAAVASATGRIPEWVHDCAVEAVRRGCRFLAVGPRDNGLAAVAEQARAPAISFGRVGDPADTVWEPAAALLTAAERVGLAAPDGAAYEAAAARLEQAAVDYGPGAESWENEAKTAAADLAGSLPLVCGATPVAETAARYFASRMAAVAGYPAVCGRAPGVLDDRIAFVDGPFGGTGPRSIFDDPVEDGTVSVRLVLLRDPEEGAAAGCDLAAAADTARDRGVGVTEFSAPEAGAMERIAGLIALTDYATVYVAVAYGADPLAHTLVVR